MTTDTPASREQQARLYGHPDYLDDPEGLERWRQSVIECRNRHEIAGVNYNSLARLIDTIDRLKQLAFADAPRPESAADEMRQTAQELRDNANGDCNAVYQAILWDEKADALAPRPTQVAETREAIAALLPFTSHSIGCAIYQRSWATGEPPCTCGLEDARNAIAALPQHDGEGWPWAIGDRVEKVKGSSWRGKIVGTYSTSLTPHGYCVESENEPGSVQIYPVSALRLLPPIAEDRVDG